MTLIQDINLKLIDSCKIFTTSFTTADVVAEFSKKYCNDWNSLVSKFGEGGEGCGRYYTPQVYIGQMLRRLSLAKKIQFLNFIPAPAGWGNAVIASYQNLRIP